MAGGLLQTEGNAARAALANPGGTWRPWLVMKVEHAVVHRVVEQHAATHGDVAAIVDGDDALTYRELNHRANAVARHLISSGFRRGGHAVVTMRPGIDLAAVLLAVLKSGGAYTWVDESARAQVRQIAIAPSVGADGGAYRSLDVAAVLRHPLKPGPNLPVLSRPSDVACVFGAPNGAAGVLVPHATIASLRLDPNALPLWEGESSSFDLWAGLMSGATLSVATPVLADAA